MAWPGSVLNNNRFLVSGTMQRRSRITCCSVATKNFLEMKESSPLPNFDLNHTILFCFLPKICCLPRNQIPFALNYPIQSNCRRTNCLSVRLSVCHPHGAWTKRLTSLLALLIIAHITGRKSREYDGRSLCFTTRVQHRWNSHYGSILSTFCQNRTLSGKNMLVDVLTSQQVKSLDWSSLVLNFRWKVNSQLITSTNRYLSILVTTD